MEKKLYQVNAVRKKHFKFSMVNAFDFYKCFVFLFLLVYLIIIVINLMIKQNQFLISYS